MTPLDLVLAVCICLALAWAVSAQWEVYLRGRDFKNSESKWFVERQQLQSKTDILTERILQQAGQPIDLNRQAKDRFKSAIKERAFANGWKSDAPATPPIDKEKS